MAFELMQDCLDLKGTGLSSSAKFVLVALARFADKDGSNCYPSIPLLHEVTGLAERAIRNALAQLIDFGFVTRTREPGRSYQFNICIPSGRSAGSQSTGSQSAGSQSATTIGSQSTTTTGSQSAGRVVADRLDEEVNKKPIEKNKEEEEVARFARPARFVPEEGKGKRQNSDWFMPPEIINGSPELVQIFNDWMKVRKAKRSPMTQTAWDRFKSEARKSGLSLAEAMSLCTEKSWVSLRASWESVQQETTAPGHIPSWVTNPSDTPSKPSIPSWVTK